MSVAARLPEFIAPVLEGAERARLRLPAHYRLAGSAYAASDAMALCAELRKHADRGLSFLEWGSGIGTHTILAERFGFRAFGIELDPLLVHTARSLAREAESGAAFTEGNFLPPEARALVPPPPPGCDDPAAVLRADGPDAYAALGRPLGDFDVVYVFPWPDYIDFCRAVFARAARPGGRLWVYSETAGILESVMTPGGCTALHPA